MIVTNLKGNSNSTISLITENNVTFVRKKGDIDRNLERYQNLDLPFPKILRVDNSFYDLEYIKNLNITSYLTNNLPNTLISFLNSVIQYLSKETKEKDYRNTYHLKLSNINFDKFNFTKKDLIGKLPTHLPSSKYFGDLTFDNILFDIDKNRFVLIDGLTSEFDSYIFDLHKLKQDVICKWFIRSNQNTHFLDYKLIHINNFLSKYDFYDNNCLTILMLLRVYPYCKNEFDKTFIENEVNKLWTS